MGYPLVKSDITRHRFRVQTFNQIPTKKQQKVLMSHNVILYYQKNYNPNL